jgi:hypothetical protein
MSGYRITVFKTRRRTPCDLQNKWNTLRRGSVVYWYQKPLKTVEMFQLFFKLQYIKVCWITCMYAYMYVCIHVPTHNIYTYVHILVSCDSTAYVIYLCIRIHVPTTLDMHIQVTGPWLDTCCMLSSMSLVSQDTTVMHCHRYVCMYVRVLHVEWYVTGVARHYCHALSASPQGDAVRLSSGMAHSGFELS